jgi:nucleoside-diphosphate-sugar epimerase
VFATTTSSDHCAALREAGAVPIVLDLDCKRLPDRIGRLAPRVICLVPPAPEGRTDRRLQRLLHQLKQPLSRLIYISTTGIYGDRRGALVDETVAPAPITERARRRVDSERRARARPWRGSVLRVPGIYGPGRLPTERLMRAVPAPLPADDVVTNHIHIDDLAGICVTSLFRAAPGRVYNAVDDSQLHLGEYLDMVADRFGLPRAPRLSWEALRRAVSPMQFSFFEESRRLSNRRIKSELRVRLRFSTVRDGVNAIADFASR